MLYYNYSPVLQLLPSYPLLQRQEFSFEQTPFRHIRLQTPSIDLM